MGNSVAIIICTEPGPLEAMSQLLVKSVRNFGGVLMDADIYSMQPRKSAEISGLTKEVFEKYSVVHEHHLLNTKYPDYGLANKVMTCDYYARNLFHEYLLFLDSDQVVLNDLSRLISEPMADLRIRPVSEKIIGTDGYDTNAAYWKELYTICGVTQHGYIETDTDHEKVWSYYNSGLLMVRRESGLFEKWLHNFNRVMEKGLMPQHGLFFVEQSTLSATVSSMELKVEVLPKSFNYSPMIHARSNEQLGLDKIHTFHYHKLFTSPNRVHLQKDFEVFNGPKLEWLERELIACGVNSKPFYKAWELDLLAKKEYLIREMQKRSNPNS